MDLTIVYIGGINPPSKTPPLSCQAPPPRPLNLKTVQAPF